MVITFHFRPEPCDKLWAKLASVTCSCNDNGSCNFLINCTEEHSTQYRAGTHPHQPKEKYIYISHNVRSCGTKNTDTANHFMNLIYMDKTCPHQDWNLVFLWLTHSCSNILGNVRREIRAGVRTIHLAKFSRLWSSKNTGQTLEQRFSVI